MFESIDSADVIIKWIGSAFGEINRKEDFAD